MLSSSWGCRCGPAAAAAFCSSSWRAFSALARFFSSFSLFRWASSWASSSSLAQRDLLAMVARGKKASRIGGV